jgi:hypothetical protein
MFRSKIKQGFGFVRWNDEGFGNGGARCQSHTDQSDDSRNASVIGPAPTTECTADIQRTIEATKESLQHKVPSLPPQYHVITAREGIKREDQSLLQVISKAAKYTATAFR